MQNTAKLLQEDANLNGSVTYRIVYLGVVLSFSVYPHFGKFKTSVYFKRLFDSPNEAITHILRSLNKLHDHMYSLPDLLNADKFSSFLISYLSLRERYFNDAATMDMLGQIKYLNTLCNLKVLGNNTDLSTLISPRLLFNFFVELEEGFDNLLNIVDKVESITYT